MGVSKGTLVLYGLMLLAAHVTADNPCAARQIEKKSVVCVCNSTYCDEITREEPETGGYLAYTSSEAGSRFLKTSGLMQSESSDEASVTLELDPSSTHQTVAGFGAAVTDAAGINWKNLSESLQQHLVSSYFSNKGLEYNMLRVPIGGSDFSTHVYAYNELPEDDAQLTNYTLSPEDFSYKIPFIHRINEVATDTVQIIATTWSPPPWMKTNDEYTKFSRLKKEFYQTYAEYHARFIRLYKEQGIDIWGITTTNEPIDSAIPFVKFQSLGWSAKGMGKWISENLGPTFRNASDLEHVKIIALDDQRYTIPIWFNVMVKLHPEALDFIDGVGLHFYGDQFTPVSTLKLITEKHPDKFVLNTEACEGSFPWQLDKVSLGSWKRAKSYINNIMTDLNANMVGWVDWNMCLNEEGGPNWVKNFVDSPIIVFPQNDEFVKQPMFYAMGHFSKWIPRGSKRIEIKEKKSHLFSRTFDQVAFLTPKNTVVVVIHNDGKAGKAQLKLGEEQAVIELEAKSVTTVEIDYNNSL